VSTVINGNKHHNYPIFGPDKKVVGTIPKNFIITMLRYEGFYGSDE
jgi:hypothetical protein